MNQTRPRRPATRAEFEIAVICALPLEADAVDALFDHHWDDGNPPYDKAAGDYNAYSTGAVGRHNVVLAHMPGMGKANAAAVAASCRASFPNIKLAVVVGICGAVPFGPGGDEIVLGDVIISDGVVQYDLGRRLPERFIRKDTLLDSLGRPSAEVRALLAKLKGRHGRKMLQDTMAGYMDVLRAEPDLAATYPGTAHDRLFEAAYRHVGDGMLCEECGCNGTLVPRKRLEQEDIAQPTIHFGLIGSSDTVMKSGEDRDAIARQEGVIGLEMEGAGVWDTFPCVVIKGACDYADSHKTKSWQRYAAATAAACMKAFLGHWAPSRTGSVPVLKQPAGPWFLVPYPRNDSFVGRTAVLHELQQLPFGSASQPRVALCGLGGIGKTQIALEYTYWVQEAYPDMSVFWVHGSDAEHFRQAYTSIAQECQVPGHDDPKADVLALVKRWLESKDCCRWLMVIDNADNTELFFGQQGGSENSNASNYEANLGRYLPECSHGAVLVTTRNKQTGSRLTKGKRPIEVGRMDEDETAQLLRTRLDGADDVSGESSALSSRLEHLPLALVQAAAFIQENTITISEYLRLLNKSDQHLVGLLSEDFETAGRDFETPRAVAEAWILSFEQIQRQNSFAGDLLSLMSLFDRQAIPLEFLSYYGKQLRDHQAGGEPRLTEALRALKAFRFSSRHSKRQPHQETGGELQLTNALGVLKAFSFVSEDKDHGFDMHRLVQLVTRKWLARNDKLQRFAEQAISTVSQAYPFGDYENRVICSTYLPHVYAVLSHKGTGSKEEGLARASLFHRAAGFFTYQGQWKDAEKFQLQAIELRGKIQGSEDLLTLASMNNLALTYQNQDRWKEAASLGVKVMEARRSILGEEHPATLTSMDNLASTYRSQGQWSEAEALGVKVMETFKRVLGEEHPDTLISMGNLVATYWNQGRWNEAESLGIQVMETFKRVLGDEHPSTLTSMGNLASMYGNQDRWDEAEILFVQVIETSTKVLGEEHPSTLASMDSLASTYRNQGRWKEAEVLYVQVMERSTKALGGEHPATLTSMRKLSSAYRNLGRWNEAESLGDQVMETSTRVLGEEHPDTLAGMVNVALTWKKQGRLDDALELMQNCHHLQQRVLGLDHPDTVFALSAITHWLDQKGNGDSENVQ